MALPVTFVAGDVLEAAQLNSNFTYLESAGAFVRVGGSSFTSVASVAYDGVFTSTYRNYIIIGRVLSTSGNPAFNFQLTSSGTPDTADYLYQELKAAGASVTSAQYTAASSAQVINNLDATDAGAFFMTLYSPQVAAKTSYTLQNARISTSTTALQIGFFSGGHNDAGSFDGIDFLPASANITGVINIYGVTDA